MAEVFACEAERELASLRCLASAEQSPTSRYIMLLACLRFATS